MADSSSIVSVPCSTCLRSTRNEVLHRVVCKEPLGDDIYCLLQCQGCQTVCLSKSTHWWGDDEPSDVSYYPSPVSRKTPSWVEAWRTSIVRVPNARDLVRLSDEIYQAVDGGQHRLAAMGIRALLEQLMITTVGDLATFEDKLKAFEDQGYISTVQRKAMRSTLEVGHAATHRAFAPNSEELSKALDIVEGIFSAVFEHAESSNTIIQRVPPRSPQVKK